MHIDTKSIQLDGETGKKARKLYRDGLTVSQITKRLRKQRNKIWIELWRAKLPQKRISETGHC